MSLKERLKNTKETKNKIETSEFTISIKKLTSSVDSMENAEDLGNIIKEFSKFLKTLDANNSNIVFSGNFDLGQKTLLSCILSNFIDTKDEQEETADETQNETTEAKSALIKKRQSVRAKLKKLKNDN